LLVGGFVFIVAVQEAIPPRRLANLVRGLAPYVVLPGFALLSYFVWVHARFQIYLLAAPFREVFRPAQYAAHFSGILLMYVVYLVTLLGFLAGIPACKLATTLPRSRFWTLLGVAFACSVVLASVLLRFNIGEMDYGGFDQMAPSALLQLTRIAGIGVALLLFIELIRASTTGRNPIAGFTLVVLGPYLLISAFFRPTQRYLLLCLPVLLYYLLMESRPSLRRLTRWAGWSSLVVFVLVDYVGGAYLAAQGRAAEDLAQWIQSHGLVQETDPGPIAPHAGQHFLARRNTKSHFVVTVDRPQGDCLHCEPVCVLGKVIRTYYLSERVTGP
jgi:hypothetical protein